MEQKKHTINKNYPKRKKTKTPQNTKDINLMPQEMRCICGGGQSCIIDRRWIGDWVHEDVIFKSKGIELRTSCSDLYTTKQKEALNENLTRN